MIFAVGGRGTGMHDCTSSFFPQPTGAARLMVYYKSIYLPKWLLMDKTSTPAHNVNTGICEILIFGDYFLRQLMRKSGWRKVSSWYACREYG